MDNSPDFISLVSTIEFSLFKSFENAYVTSGNK